MMELTSSKTHLYKSIIDESFDLDSIKQYVLYVQLGNNFLSACILDHSRKKFIALEDFRFTDVKNPDELAEKCEAAKQESRFLSSEGFRSANCCVSFPKSILVPEPLYEKNNEKSLIDFNFSENRDEIILADDLKIIGAKNLFSVPSVIEKMLNYWFRDIVIHHHSTVFIKSILLGNKNKTEKVVTINVRTEDFDLAVTEGNKLIFYNSFQHKTSEDFLYFILFTLEQLQLNPENVPLTFTGDGDKRSPEFTGLFKYIRNVSLSERPSAYGYSYKFDNLPEPAYSLLFNQHLCES